MNLYYLKSLTPTLMKNKDRKSKVLSRLSKYKEEREN
jgi:hypothetical protein